MERKMKRSHEAHKHKSKKSKRDSSRNRSKRSKSSSMLDYSLNTYSTCADEKSNLVRSFSSSSSSTKSSSGSSSPPYCKRKSRKDKKQCRSNDNKKSKRQSRCSSSSSSCSSSERRHAKRQRSPSTDSSYSSKRYTSSKKKREERKRKKRHNSCESDSYSSSEPKYQRNHSNNKNFSQNVNSPKPCCSEQSSDTDSPSNSFWRSERKRLSSSSKQYGKVLSIGSKSSEKCDKRQVFVSPLSHESRRSRKYADDSSSSERHKTGKSSTVSSSPVRSNNTDKYVASSYQPTSKKRRLSFSSSSVEHGSHIRHTKRYNDEEYNSRGDSSPKCKKLGRSRSSFETGIVLEDQSQMTLECQCEQDLGLSNPDTRHNSSYHDQFSSPISDLRLKLDESRRQSSTPRNHRILSTDIVHSDSLRQLNRRKSSSDSQETYQTPKRSSFADLLNSNNKTPRTPQPFLASKALSFSSSREAWATQLVARSETYRYNFIDSHCHVDFLYNRMGVPFNTQYSEFMENHAHSYPVNYEGCVAVFCNPRTFNLHRPQDTILNLVSKEDRVWLALGCHPKSATEFGVSHEQGLRKALAHPKVVALGEIGLDYSGRFHHHADVQKRVLITQLKLALELGLPLVIHCRDADDDCLDIMKQYVPKSHKIHLHCFTRDPATAQRWMDAFPNLFLGFTPVITYASAWEPALSSKRVPLDRLLLETDAPYFVPGHIKNTSVKLSHPGFALFTAEKIAELRQIPVDDVLKACRKNTKRMYGI